MRKPRVRTGQGSVALTKEEFRARLGERFYDPAFDALRAEIDAVSEVAWQAYHEYRKNPRTRKAGKGFADPTFDLPVEWLETRRRLRLAEQRQKDARSRSRILLVCGADRSDQTCPGGMPALRSAATSASTSPTRPATTRSTATPPCTRRCGTPPAP